MGDKWELIYYVFSRASRFVFTLRSISMRWTWANESPLIILISTLFPSTFLKEAKTENQPNHLVSLDYKLPLARILFLSSPAISHLVYWRCSKGKQLIHYTVPCMLNNAHKILWRWKPLQVLSNSELGIWTEKQRQTQHHKKVTAQQEGSWSLCRHAPQQTKPQPALRAFNIYNRGRGFKMLKRTKVFSGSFLSGTVPKSHFEAPEILLSEKSPFKRS